MDSLEGEMVWDYNSMACPQMLVQLCKGLMKVHTNETNALEGSTAVVEHKEKQQASGLEIAESFILCGHQPYNTYVKSIAVFVHSYDRIEVAQGKFTNNQGNNDMTRPESGMSLLHGGEAAQDAECHLCILQINSSL